MTGVEPISDAGQAGRERVDGRVGREDLPGYLDRAPLSGRYEHCAMCGERPVGWVHPIAEDRAAFFRPDGGPAMLAPFWATCEWCEALYREDDEDALVSLMGRWQGFTIEDQDEAIDWVRPTLAAFRRADMGARRFIDQPPR